MKNNISLKTIAEILGISISTVSRALNGNERIGLKTKEKVFELAKKLNYVPNPGVNLLRTNASMKIGLVLPNLKSDFFYEICIAIEDFFEPSGYQVEVFQSRDLKKRQEHGLDYFLKSKVDGLLVSLAIETDSYLGFKKLENYGIPLVFFDRVPRGLACHKVISAIESGTVSAMEFLHIEGLNRIALLNGPSNLSTSDARLNGYLNGLKKYNLKSSPQLIKTSNMTKLDVFECLKKWYEQEIKPEAIIVFNDLITIYVYEAIRELSLVLFNKIKIVSFTNLSITSSFENHPIASINQNPKLIGLTSSNLLLRLIRDEVAINDYQESIIETEFVVY